MNLTHIFRNFHWDHASMIWATASKAIGGQVQNLHTYWSWIHLIWLLWFWIMIVKAMAYENLFLSKRHFQVWYLQLFKIHEFIWGLKIPFVSTHSYESKTMIVCKFWTFPPTPFEAVAETIFAWSQWKFLKMWVRYKSEFGI